MISYGIMECNVNDRYWFRIDNDLLSDEKITYLKWQTHQGKWVNSPCERPVLFQRSWISIMPVDGMIYRYIYNWNNTGTVVDCGNSIAKALELLQSSTKSSIYVVTHFHISIRSVNHTSSSSGTDWKHGLDHQGWVQQLSKTKGNHINHYFS